MRKALMAACVAATALAGTVMGTSEAQAQVTMEFGFGSPGFAPRPYYGHDPYYGQRPYYAPRPNYGHRAQRGYNNGYVRQAPRPRCFYEKQWVEGRYGMERRVYRVCR